MARLYHDKEWLEHHYCDKKWSQTEIAAFCDVSQATISKWLIKLEIETRSFSEGKFGSKNGSWADSPYKEYTTLYRLYVTENKSIPEISNISGHSPRTIQRWMREAGIKIRAGKDKFLKSRSGKNNSNWKGGKCIVCPTCGREKSYGSSRCFSCYHDFRRARSEEQRANNELAVPISKNLRLLIQPWKHQILERDGYKCTSCGDTSKLYAHHIVPFYVIRDQLIMEYGHLVNFDFSTSANRQKFLDAVQHDGRLWDLDNGTTLCEDCHKGEHARLKTKIDVALYTYNATVLDNHDGDTLTVSIDLGFGIRYKTEVRLFGVDTFDLSSSDIHKKGKAIAAKKAIETLCHPGRQVIIRTYKSGKYGRWLGILFLDHAIVNDFLLETGLAEPYVL